MVRYVLKRILYLIPVIIVVSFIVYALIELMPGTFVDSLLAQAGDLSPEEVAEVRAKYDLDKPMIYRYGKYMLHLVQGDLGDSMKTGQAVFTTYMQRLPATLLLALSSSIVGIAIAIPMGIRAARKAGSIADTGATVFSLIGMSMPPFWLGLLLMLLFSMYLRWFPTGGYREGLRSLVLPAVCCAMSMMALCARQTRSSMLDALNSDFLRTARAKGAPESIVINKHALGNAMIPIITTIGSTVSVQLAGSAVVEQVFAWPGVGRMLVEGVNTRDAPVILGCTIMTTIMYVLVMLIVDIAYAFVDPRIKSQYMNQQKLKNPAAAPAGPDDPAAGPVAAAIKLDGGAASNRSAAPSLITSIDSFSIDMGDSADTSYEGAQDYVTRRFGDIMTSNMRASDEAVARHKKRSQMGELWHRLISNKSSLTGIIILGFLVLIALGSLFISYESMTASNIADRYHPPSWQYPFGTDNLGRNTFLRVIYGSRYSIIVGFASVALSVFVGVLLGSVAGYYGGKVDNVIMRISDILASIPGLMLGMVIMVVLGMSLLNLIIAVGITGITHFIRMSRASILTVKSNEFVEAARAIGFSDLRIIVTQVLPNGLSPILVQTTISLGFSIMIAASLSFLGFGIPAPIPEWGALVSAGRETAQTTPWLMTFPGIAIMIIILGSNLLGDGLRDALDPKLKK